MTLQELKQIVNRVSTVRIFDLDVDPTADSENLEVGEDAVWLAPSGRVYTGVITAKEYFADEWHVYISDITFTAAGKIMQTGGWQPVSHVRRYADWLADYLKGRVQ